ncbi:hypothetical protein [Radiobacillus deserti]|uniref:Secreted protein n=1 Tax=Radiobacillus deserti TaxID=2594883 RepID=A0A516KJQ6_9BACI|nr:hypothetical protein [Radiobacillus deserti]QDP41628.1 hypothetical protein FN924_16490 [Radiobacillus deserti]
MKKLLSILAIVILLHLSQPSFQVADAAEATDSGTSTTDVTSSDTSNDDPQKADPGYGDIG